MVHVALNELTKKFGEVTAVDKVNLEIRDKEFLVLVGPSGCGKTTTLRMVAGLEEATDGEIFIGENYVNDLEPKDRNIAMVFQNYALYPHMSVRRNIAFGLKMRRMPKTEIAQRVEQAAKMLGLEELLERLPKELSGGQKQRVALGRAVVRQPDVFLFDEPLSNLDAKLRVDMREQLAKLHRSLEATSIYVTHDQVEAMTLGDRVVVMKDGRIQQVGSPKEVYDLPVNVFVAGFVGSPAMNFLPARLENKEGIAVLYMDGFSLELPRERATPLAEYAGKKLIVGIRPEELSDRPPPSEDSDEYKSVPARVEIVEPLGAEVILGLTLGGVAVRARVKPDTKATVAQDIKVFVNIDKLHLFDAKSEEVIR